MEIRTTSTQRGESGMRTIRITNDWIDASEMTRRIFAYRVATSSLWIRAPQRLNARSARKMISLMHIIWKANDARIVEKVFSPKTQSFLVFHSWRVIGAAIVKLEPGCNTNV